MSTLISQKRGRRSRRAAWVVLGLGGQAVVWANCSGGGYPHLPEGPFVDAGHGLVRHVPSQTVWKRCAEGQRWVRNSCVGSAMEVTATAAADRVTAVNASARGTQNAGQTSWRLPRLHELRWLVEAGCLLPAINQTQFPRTPAAPFWTETPFLGASNSAWTVDFAGGTRWAPTDRRRPRCGWYAFPPTRRCCRARWHWRRRRGRQRVNDSRLYLSGLCVPQRRHPSPTSSPSTGHWCRSPRRPSTSLRRHRPVRTAGKPRNAITRAVRPRGYGT